MSYKIEVLPGEPIIWETWGADLDPETEAEAATQEELNILNASSEPMVLVVDMRLTPLDFEAILYLASNAVPEELNHHPNLLKITIITTNEVVSKAAQGLDNEVFGFVKLDIVTSSEEALARARKLLA